MKLKSSTVISIISVAVFLIIVCILIAMANKTAEQPPDDPLGTISTTTGRQNSDHYAGDPEDWLDHLLETSDYDPNAPHGELKLYGSNTGSRFRQYNGMFIELTTFDIVYYSYEKPTEWYKLCFDPVCSHETGAFLENCQASMNVYTAPYTGIGQYPTPTSIIIDQYDNARSPVLYLSYKRKESYEINGVSKEREPDYCIERYDLSKGTRTVVIDGIKSTIERIFTYGDYIYYIMCDANWNQTICRISKSGGEMEELSEGRATAYNILSVYQDKLYYLVDSRYLSRCNLDLTGEERLLDIAELKGTSNQSSNGVGEEIVGDYFYYFADLETVNFGEKCNCYRIPLDDLSASPELIAENMIYSMRKYRFSDDTLYYQPAVFEVVDTSDFSPSISQDGTNDSDGTLYALDLKTLKRTTVCKDIGMNIEIGAAYEDKVVFWGWVYDAEANKLANNGSNYIIGTKNGDELEVWFSSGAKKEYMN